MHRRFEADSHLVPVLRGPGTLIQPYMSVGVPEGTKIGTRFICKFAPPSVRVYKDITFALGASVTAALVISAFALAVSAPLFASLLTIMSSPSSG